MLGRILHQLNDNSITTTRGTSLSFQTLDDATTTNAPTTKLKINYDGSSTFSGNVTIGSLLISPGSSDTLYKAGGVFGLRSLDSVNLMPGGATQFKVESSGLATFSGNAQLPNGYQVQWGGASNAIFGHGTNNYVAIKTNGVDRLNIDSGGTHNLYGNYIVNEQGRQDHVANTLPQPYYWFDATNDYIELTDISKMASATGALEAVLRLPEIDDNNYAHIITFSDSGNATNYLQFHYDYNSENVEALAQIDGSMRWRLRWYNPFNHRGQVVHLMLVQDGVKPKLYLNGVEQVQTGYSVETNTNEWISHGYNSTNSWDQMAIGELRRGDTTTAVHRRSEFYKARVYNYAPSVAEIKSLASGASVPYKYKGQILRKYLIMILHQVLVGH